MNSLKNTIAATILVILFPCLLMADTGHSVDETNGSLRILGPDNEVIIDRITLTTALSETEVFAVEDASLTYAPHDIPEPDYGDTGVTWTMSYMDSLGNVRGVRATYSLYWMENEDFFLLQVTAPNAEGVEIFAYLSLEIRPSIEGEGQYGGETVSLYTDQWIGDFSEDDSGIDKHFGIIPLDYPFYTFCTAEYNDFENAPDPDTFRYAYLSSYENSDFPLTSEDGCLGYWNTGPHSIGARGVAQFWVALGYGESEAELRETMQAACNYFHDDESPEFHVPPLPCELSLGSNYPNPFNPSTFIPVFLPDNGELRLAIFDLLGREVSVIHDGWLTSGQYTFQWDSRSQVCSSGIYILSLSLKSGTTRQSISRQIHLLK